MYLKMNTSCWQDGTFSAPVSLWGVDGRLVDLVRKEHGSEVRWTLDCLEAIGDGDREEKLRGAEDEEEAEGNNGTLCVLQPLEQADSETWKE